MTIKERLDVLMNKKRINNYFELLRRIYKYIKPNTLLNDIEWAEKEKGNFSKMINGKRPFTLQIIIGLEYVLDTSINYIINGGVYNNQYHPRGIEYTVSCDKYEGYMNLSKMLDDDGNYIIKNYDEFNKSLIDYIIKYKAINGIKFLCENYNFRFNPFFNMFEGADIPYTAYNEDLLPLQIAKIISINDENDLFFKIYNPYFELYDNINDKNYLYNEKEFLNIIINSEKILEAMLSSMEIEINNTNGFKLSKYTFNTIKFINPILSYLLREAVEIRNIKCVEKIIEYGYTMNEKQIDFINKKRNENNFPNIHINKDGYILDDRIKLGNLLVYNYPIDPELPIKIKVGLKKLIDQKDECEHLSKTDCFYKRKNSYKIIDNKYVLRKPSNNKIEYDLLSVMERVGFSKVPKYYGTTEGVDKLTYFKGNTINLKTQMNKEKLTSLIGYFKEFHNLCENELGMENVYLHGSFNNEDIVFENDEVVAIINWDKCKLGNPYDDIFEIIFQCTDITSFIRNNKMVLATIEDLMSIYHKDKIKNCDFYEVMKENINKKIKKLDKKSYDFSYWYEAIKYAETFFDIYEEELRKL